MLQLHDTRNDDLPTENVAILASTFYELLNDDDESYLKLATECSLMRCLHLANICRRKVGHVLKTIFRVAGSRKGKNGSNGTVHGSSLMITRGRQLWHFGLIKLNVGIGRKIGNVSKWNQMVILG